RGDAPFLLRALQAGSVALAAASHPERLCAPPRAIRAAFRSHETRRGEAEAHRTVPGSRERQDSGEPSGSGALGGLREDGRALVRGGEQSLSRSGAQSIQAPHALRERRGVSGTLRTGEATRET